MFHDEILVTNDPIARVMCYQPVRVSEGVYTNCGHNFENCLAFRQDWRESYYEGAPGEPPSYGVADSVEQFMERFGEFIRTSPHKYAVGFTEVRRTDQPESGGWRWHKWGEYVGKHEAQHEYLHDEQGIDSVVTFSVVRRMST